MGSERINRDVKTKTDSVNEANNLAQAWLNTLNPYSLYTGDNPYTRAFSSPTAEKQQTKAPDTPRGNINDGFTVLSTRYYPDGTPYDSPGKGYSIDQFGQPILHSSQTPGQSVKPVQSSALMEPEQDAKSFPTGRVDPFAPLDTPEPPAETPESAVPAVDRAATWASMRGIPVTDSTSFFQTKKFTAPDNTNDLSAGDAAIFGGDVAESAAKKDGGYTETLITPDGIGETTINKEANPATDWSKAKARAASASAFLNAEPGQGAIGPLAAAEAAVGVSRGGDKDGSFLNLQRDGKTYQIRGTQQDMATAAAEARAGKNIFGDFDFKELPVTGE